MERIYPLVSVTHPKMYVIFLMLPTIIVILVFGFLVVWMTYPREEKVNYLYKPGGIYDLNPFGSSTWALLKAQSLGTHPEMTFDKPVKLLDAMEYIDLESLQ